MVSTVIGPRGTDAADAAVPRSAISATAVTMSPPMPRSPNFPSRAVDTVSAGGFTVTTHDMCSAPPRSDTSVGDAVSTIVRSRAVGTIPGLIGTIPA